MNRMFPKSAPTRPMIRQTFRSFLTSNNKEHPGSPLLKMHSQMISNTDNSLIFDNFCLISIEMWFPYVEFGTLLYLPRVCKSFYHYCIKKRLVSCLTSDKNPNRAIRKFATRIIETSSQCYFHPNIELVLQNWPTLPQGLSIHVFAKTFISQFTSIHVESMIIQLDKTKKHQTSQFSSILDFLISFFSHSFENLHCLMLNNMQIDDELLKIIKRFPLDSLYLKTCTVRTEKGCLALVHFPLEVLCLTMINLPKIILLPRTIKEFVMDSIPNQISEILAEDDKHRCISGRISSDISLV